MDEEENRPGVGRGFMQEPYRGLPDRSGPSPLDDPPLKATAEAVSGIEQLTAIDAQGAVAGGMEALGQSRDSLREPATPVADPVYPRVRPGQECEVRRKGVGSWSIGHRVGHPVSAQ